MIAACGYDALCTTTKRSTPLCLQQNGRLIGNISAIAQTRSLIVCAASCLASPRCKSSQYHRDSATCQMNTVKAVLGQGLDYALGWVFMSPDYC